MTRRNILTIPFGPVLALSLSRQTNAAEIDSTSKATFDTVMVFMGVMGKGDIEVMSPLMADDMVWRNEGDSTMPWIGPWTGKEETFTFLIIFGENFQTTA